MKNKVITKALKTLLVTAVATTSLMAVDHLIDKSYKTKYNHIIKEIKSGVIGPMEVQRIHPELYAYEKYGLKAGIDQIILLEESYRINDKILKAMKKKDEFARANARRELKAYTCKEKVYTLKGDMEVANFLFDFDFNFVADTYDLINHPRHTANMFPKIFENDLEAIEDACGKVPAEYKKKVADLTKKVEKRIKEDAEYLEKITRPESAEDVFANVKL
jgi:hypothetical protein